MTTQYTNAFKLKITKRILTHNEKIKDIAEEYAIPQQTLYGWLSTFNKHGAFPGKGNKKTSISNELKQLETDNNILKDALFIPKDKASIFDFIYNNKDDYPITRMCKLLNVSVSGYYKHIKDVTSPQELNYNRLVRLVKDIYIKYGPDIGSPTITALLNNEIDTGSQATVSRILKEHKEAWNTGFSHFHADEDVVLHFHNKDTVFDTETNTYFHEVFAKDQIGTFLEGTKTSNFKLYKNGTFEHCRDYHRDDNLLIHADNLHALYHLNKTFSKRVKLIYIDVPYNTQRYNLSYQDYFSRSDYLTLMKNRLTLAKSLLKQDGSIFIHCDDKEGAYLKVLCDEIFGIDNFVNQIVWRNTFSQQNRSHIATTKSYILVYARNKRVLQFNQPIIPSDKLTAYRYTDSKGSYRISKLRNSRVGYYRFDITTPNGLTISDNWDCTQEKFNELLENGNIYWSKNNIPYEKVYMNGNSTKIINDLWVTQEFGTTYEGTRELNSIIPDNKFTYPKPTKLLKHIIELASNENDIILDFFAGSGTTAVAAATLNRRFISVELEEDNFNLMVKRLQHTLHQESSFIKNSFITCKIE